MSRIAFLDRDGVVNAVKLVDGKPHAPASLAEVQIPEDVPDALNMLREAGYILAVVSNQPDVARGLQSRKAVEDINDFLATELEINHFEICYHDDRDNCACRKPRPGLLFAAARALGGTVNDGVMIGDRWRDIDAGRAANCRTVWIDRAYKERAPEGYDYRASTLLEAARWICGEQDARV